MVSVGRKFAVALSFESNRLAANSVASGSCLISQPNWLDGESTQPCTSARIRKLLTCAVGTQVAKLLGLLGLKASNVTSVVALAWAAKSPPWFVQADVG